MFTMLSKLDSNVGHPFPQVIIWHGIKLSHHFLWEIALYNPSDTIIEMT